MSELTIDQIILKLTYNELKPGEASALIEQRERAARLEEWSWVKRLFKTTGAALNPVSAGKRFEKEANDRIAQLKKEEA